MGRWLAILGLLVLAACQQPAGTGPQPTNANLSANHSDIPEDWSTTGTRSSSRYFDREQDELGKRLAAHLMVNCYQHGGDEAALNACLREGLIDTFDDSGEGRQNCGSLAEINAFTDCIVFGNAAVDMMQRMESKLKMTAADWAGRRPIADFIAKVIISSAIMACGDAETKASADACLVDWYRKALAVPDRLAKRCSADLSDYDRGACLGEASIVRFLEDHVDRMPGIGI